MSDEREPSGIRPPSPMPDDAQWLLATIARLDHTEDDGADDERQPLHRHVSAAMAVAFADAWVAAYPSPRVPETAAAARAYERAPSDETWGVFFRAATNSYAFGPGEGCHSIAELGGGCKAGSGCRTGIGWIWSLVQHVGAAPVREELERVLAISAR